MHIIKRLCIVGLYAFTLTSLTACAHQQTSSYKVYAENKAKKTKVTPNYASRIPNRIDGYGEKVVIVYPRHHAWGAYDASGNLIRAGAATAGANWCPDIGRRCRTTVGTFRIQSLGSAGCKSSKYPKPRGGAPMPYCMFFNGHQGLHGSYNVVDGNASHGCVRMNVSDAKWMRYDFATVGTKVVVKPY